VNINDNTLNNKNFSEAACAIFDYILNVKRAYDPSSVLETPSITLNKNREDLESEWNKLTEVRYLLKKDYQWIINPSYDSQVKKAVENFLKNKNITLEACIALVNKEADNPSKLALLIRLIGQITEWEERKYVSFVDYGWGGDLGHFCEELVKNGIMFRESSSSRKHSYRTYHLRVWPFDAKEAIISVVKKRMNIERLSNEEWRVISVLLLSPSLRLKYETIRSNLDFTEPELREIITGLKRRGIIEEKYNEIYLPEGLKEPFFQYFNTSIYPQVKQEIVNNLKRKISRALSNLWIFSGVKRVYELPIGEEKLEPLPIKLLSKNEIDPQLLLEAKKLNLVLEFDDKVLIRADIINEIENWLKGSIKETLIYIPAEDVFLASNILRDIFSKCEEYVKIQDPYIGEESFHILQYVPNEIKIQLLTGIKLGWGEDPERICMWIERFKAERESNFKIFFLGRKDSGDPPFHDRFIISKNKCWQVGTSLKQIGRGKDTVISSLSKREKDEMIEPVFERWWNANLKELKMKNLTKLSFREWKESFMRSGE